MRVPSFTISLDFELVWGLADHGHLEALLPRLRAVPGVVNKLLEMFVRYEVPATWATVGFLMCRDPREALKYRSEPLYVEPRLNPYPLLSRMANGDASDLLDVAFAPALVEKIISTPAQELATHTFSHAYALELSGNDFATDLDAAVTCAKEKGYQLSSLVFPRNQYSERNIADAYQRGLRCVRVSPQSPLYSPKRTENLVRRGLRLVDAHLPSHPGSRPCSSHPQLSEGNRLLRPVESFPAALSQLREGAVLHELSAAARAERDYHLWWHPHNFGLNPAANLDMLERILQKASALRASGALEFRSMRQLSDSSLRP